MMKKIICLLAALSILAASASISVFADDPAVWDGSAAASFSRGSGTRDDPYLISTAAELALFRDTVNSSNSGACARLVDDINLNNIEWEPIGLTLTGFTGIFDGGGRAVENIKISKVSDALTIWNIFSDRENVIQAGGFFGVIGAGGRVKCLSVSGTVSVNETYSDNAGVYIGAIAGDNSGYIEECLSTCRFENFSLKNNNYIGVGGIVGNNRYLVTSCSNTGSMALTLNGTKSTHNQYVGGIVGYDYGDGYGGGLFNCFSAAPISISSNVSDSSRYFGGCAGAELAEAGGFKNNYYDKSVCLTAAVTGEYFNGDSGSRGEDPFGSGGIETAEMKSADFPQALGGAFSFDSSGLNNGYPVLSVMTYHEKSRRSEWVDNEIGGSEADREIYDRLYPAELMNKDLTKPITRAEFAAVAVRLYEEMGGSRLAAADIAAPFTDTSSDAAAKAYSIGIAKGVSDTEFDPYTKISREDLATMLTRVYKSLYLSGWSLGADDQYTLDYTADRVFADDADISDYAKPSVYFMVNNNVIKGLTEDTFGPKNISALQEAENYANATREQAMIMSVRSFKNLKK